jgi:pheromone shutdown protein TraB
MGTRPGDEMRVAVAIAKERGIKIAVIDRPIEITLKRLMKLTWKEKLRFVKELFTLRRKLPFDLKKVPATKVIETLLDEVKRKFPTAYRVLITERNEYMATKLKGILDVHPDKKIVAIVGAGHVKGIKKLLSNI